MIFDADSCRMLIDSDIFTNLSRWHRQVSLQDIDNQVGLRFSCHKRWRRQHDHKQLLAYDISILAYVLIFQVHFI